MNIEIIINLFKVISLDRSAPVTLLVDVARYA